MAGLGLWCRIQALSGGGGGPAPVAPFQLVNEAGSPTIAAFDALRVSIAGGPWQTLAAAGLTVAQSADGELTVSGFSSQQAVRFHIEHEQPGEPFNSPGTVAALYAKMTGGAPNPVNPAMPGLPLSATINTAPIEVLP